MRRGPVGFCLLFAFVGLLVAGGAGRARAAVDSVDELVAEADPDVRAALEAQPADARAALGSLLARGVIPRERLAAALGKQILAPYVVDTLRALAQVDQLAGAAETFERVITAGDDGGVRGASFELVAAAALGDRVAGLGAVVDGNEVDLLLVDGTRVEVKNDAPDDGFELSGFLARKAIKQLRRRGAFGHPVMLISNEPLDEDALASFQRQLGPRSEILVLAGGRLSHQLERRVEGRVQRARRVVVGGLRRAAYHGQTRTASALRPVARRLGKRAVQRTLSRLRGQRAQPAAR